MKTKLLLIGLAAMLLASCGGPRSYQVEAHAGGGVPIMTSSGAMMMGPSGASSIAQSEADKSKAFWGASR